MISVSIASGQENDRRTVTAMLAVHSDFRIASIGKDGYDALQSAKTLRPDIIIMDFCLSDIESPELAPIIRRHSPSTGIIVLYSPAEQGVLDRGITAGISGYLPKPGGFENLASSVRCVFYGGLYVCGWEKCRLSKIFNKKNSDGNTFPGRAADSFSPTEQGIFRGIALGYNDEEIAEDLHITTGALRNNVNNAKHKTGLRNRTQIAVYAMFCGIINYDKICEQFTAKRENTG